MIFVLLTLLIICCIYKKHYRNYKILHISITIWTIITLLILLFRPNINNNINTYTIEENLKPFENDLNESETFYLIFENNKIYYKTNKIHSLNCSNSIIFNYNSDQPKIIKYYKQNSTLWYFLTLHKKTRILKTEFFINNNF
jgi:hypothetical protein